MNRWLLYVKERSPIIPLLALSAGVVESARVLAGQPRGTGVETAFVVFYLLFFICLRMMDEVKDFKKDLVVHPTRPIPRGLIQVGEMKRAVFLSGLALTVLGAAMGGVTHWIVGALAIISVFYAFLMYYEFFVGQRLARWPFVYAFTHQIICVPLYSAVWFAYRPQWESSWGYYLVYSIGAGFVYEIGRKLDPAAHPALGTYRQLSGDARTFASFYLLLAVCAYGGLSAGLEPLLAPFQVFCAFTGLLVWMGRPRAHKLAEGACVLLATVHLWAPVLAPLFRLGLKE